MKIICNKREFADMVRQCKEENCYTCVLLPICESVPFKYDEQDNFDVSIVDLCEVCDDG